MWFAVQRSSDPKLKLFCFPYAGGGATIFHGWGAELPAEVEVWALRLPGRGSRLREPPIREMPVMVEAVLEALAPELSASFAFFGHSMGAKIAFEVTRALAKRSLPPPVQLFLSASRAPQLPLRRRPVHELPDEEFVDEVRRYEGTPAELFDDPELLAMHLPVLRSDLQLNDTHRHVPGPPLAVPISVLGGVDDPDVLPDDLEAWSMHTSSTFELHTFPGGHFYLKDSRRLLLDHLSRDLAKWL